MTDKQPSRRSRSRAARARGSTPPGVSAAQRYRRLPAGSHGLDPELVKRDQRQRLRAAMVELIASKGYPAVRISDLSKLAHVSPPTLYSLYTDKEELFLGTYEDIAQRLTVAILEATARDGSLEAALRAFAEFAAEQPQAISLLVLGSLGAGPRVLDRRRAAIEQLEAYIVAARRPGEQPDPGDLIVKALLGGIREVTAARLRSGRQQELPELAEPLAKWALAYPAQLPDGLSAPPLPHGGERRSCPAPSERARQAEGRLPSGPSHLSRGAIVKRQQERIVDATAAIVAEKGLAALTIPEIARRANVSNETFYSLYPSKQDAFLGAQKVALHQALRITVEAYESAGEDWARAVVSGLRALLCYLASEPAHARLALVDTFAATDEALAIRSEAMQAFGAYLAPGFAMSEREHPQPEVVAEAIVGGIWGILHRYIEADCAAELPAAAAQLGYFVLAPFLGPERAAAVALSC